MSPAPSQRRIPSHGFGLYFALRFSLVWAGFLVRAAWRWLGRRPGQFVVLTPPFLPRQKIRRGGQPPIEVRIRNVVDLCTLNEIFWDRGYDLSRLVRYPEIQALYDRVAASGRRPAIVDCGANMGLASRYFAEEYRAALVLAVEPDEGNAALARLNNDPERVEVRQCGVASESKRARFFDPGRGNTAFRVEADESGDIELVSLNSIVAEIDRRELEPFIVKIDIEGFEQDLFASHLEWIDRFPVLVIELHDWLLPGRGAARAFLRAVGERNRDFVHMGENVFSLSNDLLVPRAEGAQP